MPCSFAGAAQTIVRRSRDPCGSLPHSRGSVEDPFPVEVGLVDDLIDSGDAVPALSLVADLDGKLVGHVICSKATVGDHPAVLGCFRTTSARASARP
jgi:hypothetical protein